VVTPKQNIRIPRRRWQETMARAETQGTDASKIVNILLVAYLDGSLDEVVASGLSAADPVPSPEPVSSGAAAGNADGAGGHVHDTSG
jgi:hypothetical protein